MFVFDFAGLSRGILEQVGDEGYLVDHPGFTILGLVLSNSAERGFRSGQSLEPAHVSITVRVLAPPKCLAARSISARTRLLEYRLAT